MLRSRPLRTVREIYTSYGSSLNHFITLSLMVCVVTPSVSKHPVLFLVSSASVLGHDVVIVDGIAGPECRMTETAGVFLRVQH